MLLIEVAVIVKMGQFNAIVIFMRILPHHTAVVLLGWAQSYIYQVLQTIQMKLILLCDWAEPAVLGRAKTALKFI